MTKYAGKQEPLCVSPAYPERTLSIQNIHLGICETVTWGPEFCHFQHLKVRNGAKLQRKICKQSNLCLTLLYQCFPPVHALGFLNQQSTLYLNSKSSLFHTRLHSSPVSSCLPYYSMCACSIRQCKMSLGHCHQSLQRTKEVAFPREEQKYPGTNQLSITLVTKHFGHHRALYHPDGLQQRPFVKFSECQNGPAYHKQ